MESGIAARATCAVFVLGCCVVAMLRSADDRPRTKIVTELVSVMYVTTRAAPPAAPQPAPAVATAPRVVVATADARPRIARVPIVRRRDHRLTQVVARPGTAKVPVQRVVVVTEAEPVPRVLRPLRRLGLALQARLTRAGVVPACTQAQGCEAGGSAAM
jgi:hypothetical protein